MEKNTINDSYVNSKGVENSLNENLPGNFSDNVLFDDKEALIKEINESNMFKAKGYVIHRNLNDPINELNEDMGIYIASKFANNDYFTIKLLVRNKYENESVVENGLRKEYALLERLKDVKGIVQVMDILEGEIKDKKILALVTECVQSFSTSLYEYIIKEKTKLTDESLIDIFKQIIQILHELHTRYIVHSEFTMHNLYIHRSTQAITLSNFENNIDMFNNYYDTTKSTDFFNLARILYTLMFNKDPETDLIGTKLTKIVSDNKAYFANHSHVKLGMINLLNFMLRSNYRYKVCIKKIKRVFEKLVNEDDASIRQLNESIDSEYSDSLFQKMLEDVCKTPKIKRRKFDERSSSSCCSDSSSD